MFYTMMYSSKADEWAAAPREERGWMVRYLTEGLVRTQVSLHSPVGPSLRTTELTKGCPIQDWKIYRRRQVFELVASLFHSSRQDAPLRKLILQVSLFPLVCFVAWVSLTVNPLFSSSYELR